MTVRGKGFFTWKIKNCEAGEVLQIATLSRSAGLTHLMVKVANGSLTYNVDTDSNIDYARLLVEALHAQKIQAWGWHYIYGENPISEANAAVYRIRQLQLDGYVIDAEAEYKKPGKREAAARFMSILRTAFPDMPMALSSYRYPSYHPSLPWREFLEKCDLVMPQVYWMQAHNAGDQLVRSVREFNAMTPSRPVIPTGAAFREHGWQPTPKEVLEFMQTAKALNLMGVNFWEWSDARGGNLPGVWETVANFSWSPVPGPKDITEKFIQTLNSHDINQVAALYSPAAVHITSARTIQGLEAISKWYKTIFEQMLPQAVFTLTGFSGTGNSRHMTWTAVSPKGKVLNGNDTFGLVNEKIAYHYTFFTVTV